MFYRRRLHRALDGRESLVHHGGDGRRNLVRQKISNPDEPSLTPRLGKDLGGGIVVCHPTADRRPRETTLFVVNVNDHLTCDDSIAKRHHASPVLHAHIGDESGCQPRVEGAHVAKSIPYGSGVSIDQYFFMN